MGDGVWTIKAALDWTCDYLAKKADENPRLSAQWLLSEACGLSRTELYLNLERPLSADERTCLRDYVTRRGKGEPLQYITGEVAFRHITIKVCPGVLIPRPETEVLVSEVLAALPAVSGRQVRWNEEAARQEQDAVAAAKEALAQVLETDAHNQRVADDDVACSNDEVCQSVDTQALLVADLCTGSGCIACSLAYEHPDIRVIATDISPDACALARQNVDALGLGERVAVLECSLGTGIGSKRNGTFDAVVSNPPYVPTEVLASLPREVADFEPALALDGGVDGLALFRPLVQWAFSALKPNGLLACELYEGHLDAAARFAVESGFGQVKVTPDLTDRPRVLTARKAG